MVFEAVQFLFFFAIFISLKELCLLFVLMIDREPTTGMDDFMKYVGGRVEKMQLLFCYLSVFEFKFFNKLSTLKKKLLFLEMHLRKSSRFQNCSISLSLDKVLMNYPSVLVPVFKRVNASVRFWNLCELLSRKKGAANVEHTKLLYFLNSVM